jgi:aminopeptidase N
VGIDRISLIMKYTGFIALLLNIHCYSFSQVYEHKLPESTLRQHQSKMAYHSQSVYNELMENYDVTFYKLDLSAGNSSAYIEGSTTVNAIVRNQNLDTFAIELYSEYTVDSVLINDIKHGFIRTADDIIVAMSPSITKGSGFNVEIFYHGELSQEIQEYGVGIVNLNITLRQITYTLSEPFFSKFWFPCKQVLEDKADSVYVFVTVDSTLKVGANGLLTAVTPIGNGKVRYEWKSKYSIAYYLISMSIADYVEYNIWARPEGLEDSILIQNFVYDSAYLENHKQQIEATADLIEVYSELFGIYPFKDEKYGHCLAPIGGGMEHQTMTTLSNLGFDLVAHELAHQWFGDYVTCGTWQDIWINEGFATYCEVLAQEFVLEESGDDRLKGFYDYLLYHAQEGSVFVPEEDFDIDYGNSYQLTNLIDRIFDSALSYYKGAYLLHMIRFELQDDDLFFLVLKNYLSQFGDSVATGLDFKTVLESTSGKDFTDFFDQWYYGEGYPVYNVRWEQEDDSLFIDAVQTVTAPSTPLFKMPVDYRLIYAGGDTTLILCQQQNIQSFKIWFPKQITEIEVNPDINVLARIESVRNGLASGNIYKCDNSPLVAPITNPFSDYIRLEFSESKIRKAITMYDISGMVILKQSTRAKSLVINTTGFKKGIYLVEINAAGLSVTEKLVKE